MGVDIQVYGSNKPLWSILVCSTPAREFMWSVLRSKMLSLIGTLPIQVISATDPCEITVGAKRNLLVSEARGEYVSFVDSDDDVYPTFIESQYVMLQGWPDCLSLEGTITRKGIAKKPFIHSLKYSAWFEKREAYYRSPNHLNVIRTDIIRQAPFEEISWVEDRKFSTQIYPLLHIERHVPGPQYIYRDAGPESANMRYRKDGK